MALEIPYGIAGKEKSVLSVSGQPHRAPQTCDSSEDRSSRHAGSWKIMVGAGRRSREVDHEEKCL